MSNLFPEWLRGWNAHHADKVRFVGIDIQDIEALEASLRLGAVMGQILLADRSCSRCATRVSAPTR
jgi:hypothetical protein